MTAARKRWVCLGLLLAGVLAVEGLARWLFADELDPVALRRRQQAHAVYPLIRFSEDAELYYEMRRNLDIHYRGIPLRTDGSGQRIRADSRPEPKAVDGDPVRLAVVGPSTTFGLGVELRESYVERLVPRLAELWGRPVELHNFSVPAYVSVQEARLFEVAVLPWDPDVVLWHYDHRDAYPLLTGGTSMELPETFGDNLLHSAAWKLVARRLRLRAMRFRGEEYALQDGYVSEGVLYDRHIDALQRSFDLAAQADIPVIVVIHDAFLHEGSEFGHHYGKLHAPLIERLQGPGVHFVDLYHDILETMADGGWADTQAWWLSVEPLDGHPNAAGHRFIAQHVAQAIGQIEELRGFGGR